MSLRVFFFFVSSSTKPKKTLKDAIPPHCFQRSVVISLSYVALDLIQAVLAMGAIYPDFKADNVARVASGPAGVLFMVTSLSFTFLVVGLEVVPAWLIMRAGINDRLEADHIA